MKRLYLYLSILFLSVGISYGQDDMNQSLAIQFYQNGEYEKAAEIFEKLYSKDPNSPVFYRYLFNSYLQIKEYDKLEKVVKKAVKKNPDDLRYLVDLGYMYIQSGEVSKGQSEYKKAIGLLEADNNQISRLANAFIGYGELDLAANTYERGRQLFNDKYLFALELASVYDRNNDMEKAIINYLDYVEANPANVQVVKNKLQSTLEDDEHYELVQTELLTRVQRNSNQAVFSELLIWLYIQKKNFKMAFIQTKALDKRNNENGFRVLNLGRTAITERYYDVAVEAFQYVIDKGKNNSLYLVAKQEMLNARKAKLTNSPSYTIEDVQALNMAYDDFMDEFGLNRNTVNTLREKAQVQALYLDDYDKAIAILEELLSFSQADKIFKGEVKLELGDYYLMKGEVWESTLLYSQVDKDFDDEPLGEMARFKNAKLSYYQGDFEWAQAQLDILKASTSELIANDALNLSVFITDNLGLDTTLYPMEMYAKADLLFLQNKLNKAISTMDSVINIFPGHGLADDILFTKSKIYMKKKDFTKSAELLEDVLKFHSDDLLGDDATFALAELYQYQLGNTERAMELYQELMINYKDSVLVVEARKRFRKLRGDEI